MTGTKITCDFDLTGASTGTWDVVVTNPDTQEGTLPFGFRVQLSSGSLSAWGYNFYHECDVLAGNDFIAVSGEAGIAWLCAPTAPSPAGDAAAGSA